jgi:hypothetical protein
MDSLENLPPFTVGCHVVATLDMSALRMRRFVHTQTQDALPEPQASVQARRISVQLEAARVLIETRFSDAGGQLSGSLDMVGRLIVSLDNLGVALNADSVASTTRDLLDTADGLTALPEAQQGRMAYLGKLKAAGSGLDGHINEMRTTLRYLRAFALNIKITAGATIRASDEFAGFADSMCQQLDQGVAQLDELSDELTLLIAQLEGGLAFERGLSGKYRDVIPAVPDRLTVDARVIGQHHTRIAGVALSVGGIARSIQAKVGNALMALQIGDITRQRIEHVQLGIAVTARVLAAAELTPEAGDRAARRLLHLVAAQMTDVASDFETEAAKVARSLAGMAQDTAQIMVVHSLSDGGADTGLRGLESSLGHAGTLVEDVTAAMTNAQRISTDTASAVEALGRRITAIQRVKRDIQQMAINSSLRCNRLGEIGKPLNVIAIELGSQAGLLEEAANQTLASLTGLADLANGLDVGDEGDARIDAGRLDEVRGRLRQAADVVEHDLAGLGSHGEATARSLALAADQLGLKEDLGDALHTAAIALSDAAGPVVEDLDDIADLVQAAMAEIARCYTMARERVVHADHAPAGQPVETIAPVSVVEATAAEEFDDILF